MAEAERQAGELVEGMTPQERLHLVCGSGAAMGLNAIPRLGIPALNMVDASGGVRIVGTVAEAAYRRTTAFPCPMLLAATWNPELARQMARAIGEECRVGGIHILLGPGMNIYRMSRCGRNFEYMGEDPFLAGRMIAGYVQGLQETGVVATLKHFAANNAELKRRGSNSVVSERALREIYFPAFQAGIEAGAWAVMSAYNQLNGIWCGENRWLLTDILRGEMGFQGLCMTDWQATWHGDRVAASGTDLEMPEGAALKFDRDKVFGTPEVDRMACNVLRTLIRAGVYEAESAGTFRQPGWVDRYPEHVAVAGQVNAEGIVLLKNDGILPLDERFVGALLVTGNAAERAALAGGGSAHVAGYDLKTYAQAVQEGFPAATVVVAPTPSDADVRQADAVLVFSGYSTRYEDGPERHEGECLDRPFELLDEDLIVRCTRLNPRTVVAVVVGGGVRMEWADRAGAIVQPFLGGQTAAPVLVDVLRGRINPSGKLPFTIERRFEDSPAFGYDRNPFLRPVPGLVDRLPSEPAYWADEYFRSPDGEQACVYDIEYREDVFVGYRGYDRRGMEVRFPFGHGLSYTRFEFSGLRVENENSGVRIQVEVANAGQRPGAEVVQVYVHDVASSVERPPQELKGFAKVHLAPGESRTVNIVLGADSFRFWHPITKMWTEEPGMFEIRVGASSRDIRLRSIIERRLP